MKCYLFDAALGRNIPSAEAVEMDCAEILAEWDGLADEPGSFLGVICPPHPPVQFMWEDADRVTIDIPLPEKRGSLAKDSDYEECCNIIQNLWDGANPLAIPGMRFVAW